MTLSIIARCARTGGFGVAAATSVPAVGKLLSYAWPLTGAAATQGLLNPYLGIDAIRLLEEGKNAAQTVEDLTRADTMAARRQLAVIDAQGRTAVWTGEGCKDWAGFRAGDGFSVQGNRLAGPEVVDAALERFEALQDANLIDRLIQALAAGIGAGGDRLGERSATAYVVEREEYPVWDIRVDDHDDPIGELFRLKDVFAEKLLPHIRQMATRERPFGEPGEYDV